MTKNEIAAARKYAAECKAAWESADQEATLAYLSEDERDLPALNSHAEDMWHLYQEALTHLPCGDDLFTIEVKENGRVR